MRGKETKVPSPSAKVLAPDIQGREQNYLVDIVIVRLIFALTLTTNTTAETVAAGGPIAQNLPPWANAGPDQRVNAPTTNACPHCHSPRLPHRVCPTCGNYKGREVLSPDTGDQLT